MIKSRIPVVGCPIVFKDLIGGIIGVSNNRIEMFENNLAEMLGCKYCIAVGSGKTAFYLILKYLSSKSQKKEIILPAYTDAGLVLAIQKAGLKPVLCDISRETFNLDTALLSKVISENTLAVLAVHMFGIPCGVKTIQEITRPKNIFLIEDCAQAQGTKISNCFTGTIADAGFFSFNRGKNLPTYSGGCVSTNSKELKNYIAGEIKSLKEQGILSGVSALFKITGLALAVRPGIYGAFYPLIAPFKSNTIPTDFTVLRYTHAQAGVAVSLLKNIGVFSRQRHKNGLFLIEQLKDLNSIILPEINPDDTVAFNRLPIVFKDTGAREKISTHLFKKGIECSYMYPYSLHHIFDLRYKKEDFPNAVYFARHLLTLPVHPLVGEEDLSRMVKAIKGKL